MIVDMRGLKKNVFTSLAFTRAGGFPKAFFDIYKSRVERCSAVQCIVER
jgi:hypothetical protein